MLAEMESYRIDASVVAYSVAIGACVEAQQWQVALRLLHRARELELAPDMVTYSAAVGACQKGPPQQAKPASRQARAGAARAAWHGK